MCTMEFYHFQEGAIALIDDLRDYTGVEYIIAKAMEGKYGDMSRHSRVPALIELCEDLDDHGMKEMVAKARLGMYHHEGKM